MSIYTWPLYKSTKGFNNSAVFWPIEIDNWLLELLIVTVPSASNNPDNQLLL